MKELVKNAFKCKKCGQLVESKTRHDFATCKCGNFTDGGLEYIRRGGNLDDMEDACEWAEMPPKKFRPEHLKRMGVTMVEGGKNEKKDEA